MNVADTEVVRSVLAGAGYTDAASPAEADVVLVNTCAIREKAEDKIWCRLGTFRALREERRAKDRCASRDNNLSNTVKVCFVGLKHWRCKYILRHKQDSPCSATRVYLVVD